MKKIDIDQLLVFDIKGKFGHFRKFYTNSSSLTYYVPPRTVLIGFIASILEYNRDSYYNIFSEEKCKLSLSILNPLKKHFECLNYKNEKGGGYTQIRFELLMSLNGLIKYRVFFWHKDKELLKRFERKIKENKKGYGIYLGQRPFIASIEFIDTIGNEKIKLLKFCGELNSITPIDNILGAPKYEEGLEYVRERIPISFLKIEKGREIDKSPRDILIELNKSKIKSTNSFREAYKVEYKFKDKNLSENIAFV